MPSRCILFPYTWKERLHMYDFLDTMTKFKPVSSLRQSSFATLWCSILQEALFQHRLNIDLSIRYVFSVLFVNTNVCVHFVSQRCSSVYTLCYFLSFVISPSRVVLHMYSMFPFRHFSLKEPSTVVEHIESRSPN